MSKSTRKSNKIFIPHKLYPKTDNQEKCIELIKESRICFIDGCFGTGKTHLGASYGIVELLNEQFDRMIISRPCVSSQESLGFLPGSIRDKTYEYMVPIFEECYKYIDSQTMKDMIKDGQLQVCPVGFMRGRNFHRAYIQIDEFQNLTYQQFILILSRIGKNSKLIFTGDSTQRDVKSCYWWDIENICKKLSEIDSINYIKFTEDDIVRDDIVKSIFLKLREMNEYKIKNDQPN